MIASPNLQSEPWNRLPSQTVKALWTAGYVTGESVAVLGGTELRAIPGIGTTGYRAIREIWPDPGGAPVGANGGQLNQGNPSNKGGGRPPSRVREVAAIAFEERIPLLGKIADDRLGRACPKCGRGDDRVGPADQIRAIDMLGKYSIGTKREITENTLSSQRTAELAAEFARAVKKRVPQDVCQAIFDEWREVIQTFFAE